MEVVSLSLVTFSDRRIISLESDFAFASLGRVPIFFGKIRLAATALLAPRKFPTCIFLPAATALLAPGGF